ncbi:MAG: carboxypeptidase regulatory-like domain-containing protein [Acidobacteria bacterium]|nr:carboxypeptidase regulatory-like domain-containing protein [Acidobacteriota bacterium]
MRSKIYFLFILTVFLTLFSNVRAAVFVVDRADDAAASICSGAANDCTLRGAIIASNAGSDAANTINFNIPGGGVHTINVLSALPGLTRSVTINGASQSGYFGKPLIELNGANAGSQTDGLSIKGLILGQIAPTTTYSIYGLAINRFDGKGISLDCTGGGLCNLTLLGNFIGTDPTGAVALPNSGAGVGLKLKPSTDYQIGGTGIFEGNLISGNDSYGIYITAPDNFGIFGTSSNVVVQGNKIGTNYDGTAALGNFYGIFGEGFDPANDINLSIGGTTSNARNLISGNTKSGIYIFEASASGQMTGVISGNYIGTNAAGTADLGNGDDGIEVIGDFHTTVGGTAAGAGNLISGNNRHGINVFNSSVKIQGNQIGTNDTGLAALGNSQNGIFVFKTAGGVIGPETENDPAGGNLISGNSADGIRLEESAALKVFNNKIGTNPAGDAEIPNQGDGVEIKNIDPGSPNNGAHQIGNNVISGNFGHGLLINGIDALSNIVEGNFIGTAPSGFNLGNHGRGVSIAANASQNVIGGTNAGTANVIAFNLDDGVGIDSGTNNAVRRNSIYSNAGLGIDLGASGVSANDPNDVDAGANNLQNFPVLTVAATNVIAGTLNSAAGTNYTIDFFRVDSCDASGNGEGRYYLGSTNVSTPANGTSASIGVTTIALTAGQIVTATATDPNGNSSEFSQCRTVTPAPGNLTFSAASYSANEGASTRTIVVSRTGGSFGPITVDYATSNGTAAAPADYAANSGTLTFLNGETLKTFDVSIVNDNLDEPDETVNLTLSNPSTGVFLTPNATSVLTIQDNDTPPTVSISDVAQPEQNVGTTQFLFNVTLSAPSGLPVTVDYATADGTANANSDFASAGGTVNFAPGETFKTIAVTVFADFTPELDETFFVDLSGPANATLADAQGLGTILDDDNPGKFSFAFAPYSGVEGDNVLVTVSRLNGAAGTVSVDYAAQGGTALAGSDYLPAAGTLVFLNGETTRTFNVRLLDDSIPEPIETVNLTLSNPNGGASLGAPSVAVLNISDNDGGNLWALGGQVKTAGNIPVGGVSMKLEGGSTATATTDANGRYTFANLAPNSNYTITPAAIGYTFTPLSQQINNLSGDNFNVNFTAAPAPVRQVRVVGGNAAPGQNVQATVQLVAQGDENSLGFSLNYDPATLLNPQVSLSADAANAFLTVNNSQSGKLGVLLALPAGQTFAVGTRSLVTIVFNTTATGLYSSPVTFGDAPLARGIANLNANELSADYLDGAVTFAQGFEADVAPRPTGSGNGTITISDFTQIGRFVAGLDTLNAGFNEFQRADCAPRVSLGSGTLTVADYTQAGRYAAGLDPVSPTGGQFTQTLLEFDETGKLWSKSFDPLPAKTDRLAPPVVRVVDTQTLPGQQVTVSIETTAQGTENGFGFSLAYDPAKLGSPVIQKGADTQPATLITNTLTAGKIGVVLAMPFGQAVQPGTRQLVTIGFAVAANAAGGQTPLVFGDLPVIREVSDTNANVLPANFTDGAVNILVPTAAEATIGGRITDNAGNGLPRVRLELTDAGGQTRAAATDQFGRYRFSNVAAGGVYVLSVSSRRYIFDRPTRVVTVEDDIGDLDFIGRN